MKRFIVLIFIGCVLYPVQLPDGRWLTCRVCDGGWTQCY
jgi:hypothetical protein